MIIGNESNSENERVITKSSKASHKLSSSCQWRGSEREMADCINMIEMPSQSHPSSLPHSNQYPTNKKKQLNKPNLFPIWVSSQPRKLTKQGCNHPCIKD
ncbi:unnamed protein product [Lathyrus oleraceus]